MVFYIKLVQKKQQTKGSLTNAVSELTNPIKENNYLPPLLRKQDRTRIM